MRASISSASLAWVIFLLIVPADLSGQGQHKLEKIVSRKLTDWNNPVTEWQFPARLKPDSVKVSATSKSLGLYFPPSMSYNPIREEYVNLIENSIREALGNRFRNFGIQIYTNGFTADQLIPNYYRRSLQPDSTRLPSARYGERPVLVKRPNSILAKKGLYENNIALWHSHGFYFDMTLDRWEWQRAKLFGTVEDISVMGYVLPYLTRMLENSGATVFLPRERDTQTNEVIVDNDLSSGNSEFVIHINEPALVINEGFLKSDTVFTGDNPFKKGTSLRINNGFAEYIPDFPEDGTYAVSVSYPRRNDNSSVVKYTIRHTGGKTEFIVNQTIGGGTWIYLGVFQFKAGKDDTLGSVTVSTDADGYIALDAVRFGGGMGNVARRPSSGVIANQRSVNENARPSFMKALTDTVHYTWKLSGKPRYMEGARYYLQYAGMPDTLVYSLNKNKNDYNDDYQSRGMWVNYLMGAPDGSVDNQQPEGLGLPIDLSFAFHTDAGVTPGDSIIGTLGIYSTSAGDGKFPDGTSRLASRDLTDIVQTQVVHDISALVNPDWTRRGMWDKPYSEARRPDVPAILLELLSHQNQGDQKYGLDPRFRFLVSRAVYKGILRYLSYNEGREYIVHPLPVKSFAVLPLDGKRVLLSWEPTIDPLEPTAMPTRYRIYSRRGGNGFDNGIDVTETQTIVELENYDTIYSFRVTAVNDGGESFESETLAAGLKRGAEGMVLVVNGFDRISGPAWFDRGGMAGVEWWNDRGVADHFDIESTGDQYDFERNSLWVDDDDPGWGASYSDIEGKIIRGNSFDYPFIHGKSIMSAGRSFCSVSDEVFCKKDFDTSPFNIVDLIFGEEKTTIATYDTTKMDFQIYSPEFISKIGELTSAGTSVFMSGSYVGTDLRMTRDTSFLAKAGEYLHFKPRTGHAVKGGRFYATDIAGAYFSGTIDFNTSDSGAIYAAEAPDAIEPAGRGAVTAFRYNENNTSAGVIFNGTNKTVILGFPFETIISEADRNNLMYQILEFLNTKK